MKASGAKAFDLKADIKVFKEENKPPFIESLYKSATTKAPPNIIKQHLMNALNDLPLARYMYNNNMKNKPSKIKITMAKTDETS